MEEAETEEREGRREEALYQRGKEMLEAAGAMQDALQAPELTEQFRSFRAEGCAPGLMSVERAGSVRMSVRSDVRGCWGDAGSAAGARA